MLILFVALLVGIVLFILLVRSLGSNTKYRLKHGTVVEKLIEIAKLILLAETIIYIALFVIVIVRTLIF